MRVMNNIPVRLLNHLFHLKLKMRSSDSEFSQNDGALHLLSEEEPGLLGTGRAVNPEFSLSAQLLLYHNRLKQYPDYLQVTEYNI